MSTPRFQHTVTPLDNGLVLVVGGTSTAGFGGFHSLATAELYDPATGTFSLTGSTNSTRFDHTATLLANGQVLIAGGNDSPPMVATAEIYDPATGTFSVTSSMVNFRIFFSATLLANGKVLIAGGCHPVGGACLAVTSAELYDPAAGTFSVTGSMTTARTSQYATLLPSGKVLVAGGCDSSGPACHVLGSAELYDPATETFSPTGSLITPRYSPGTSTLLLTGKVLFAGGFGSGNSNVLASAELYDPATGTFSLTGNMTTVRTKHTLALLGDGQVLVAGGVNANVFDALQSAELYDPIAGTFSATGSMTIPRFFVFPLAAVLANGEVLIAGGAFNGPVASAELFYAIATDKDECKSGGWATLFTADGSPFKNQGNCIQFVNTGK
ncbi:MAG TPA: kelch repeat-containing protein [Bryobacteraceae bacterium]|nr:kelch repeat-containing protein [Bryobacteraceae bacterium]